MARSVLKLASRRARALSLAAIVMIVATLGLTAHSLALRDTARLSGWILFGSVLFLAAYNLRKKVTYPPVVSSSTWLQLHLYLGLVTVVLFLIHTGVRSPGGILEGGLALLFWGTALSGLVGLFLTRALPPRLSVRGEEVLFERIPMYRRELRERAERLVVRCAEESRLTTLADFYTARLAGFLAGPRHFWAHLAQSTRPRHRLIAEIRSLERYLNEQERGLAGELVEIVIAKDGLDYHHAVQSTLKGWLFVHIPLSYMLLLLGLVHAVLAYAFSAGLP